MQRELNKDSAVTPGRTASSRDTKVGVDLDPFPQVFGLFFHNGAALFLNMRATVICSGGMYVVPRIARL